MATEHRPADAEPTGDGTERPAAGDNTLPAAADPAVVGPWLAEELGESRWSPCRVARIGAGRSNLTFRVDSAAGSVVLRRPPLGALAAGAHDMGREQRALRALHGSLVPVPAVLAGTDESGPLNTPCYVMELIEGVVATDELPAGFAERPDQRHDLGYGLLDVLVRLHSIDPAGVGLADFGRPDGFLARQLRIWSRQLDSWRDGRDWPALTELAVTLRTRLPESGPATIVHGDYRIDNVVLDRAEPGRVLAVLDWEMATLGDPLADLGLMLVTWQQAEEHDQLWTAAQVLPSPTVLPGFPTRAQAATHYARRSGRSIRQLPWYIAFGCFKLAVVLVGVVSRARAGAVPADTATGLQRGIIPLARLGDHVVHTERY
ncbi:MAG TPA: phosphotransferase family protein [Pseudonocardiaceae bacterium]|jgi:aminoglycoside phosphotransferase (APT) family kinase protein